MNNDTLTVINISRMTIHNGPGVRTLVLFKGCPLRCKWCSTPESLRYEQQLIQKPGVCIGCGNCMKACPQHAITFNEKGPVIDRKKCNSCFACVNVCHSKTLRISGTKYRVEELVKELKKDAAYFKYSEGGVTLSGGEFTFMEFEAKLKLVKRLREEDISVGIDTCGATPREKYEKLAPYVDFYLWDVKHTDPQKHKALTGGDLDQILDNLRFAAGMGADIYLRCPIISGMTYEEAHLHALGRLAREIPNLKEVDLLPIHHLGKARYSMLGMEYPMEGAQLLTDEDRRKIYETVAAYDVPVKLVG